jgi:hypothetical protein
MRVDSRKAAGFPALLRIPAEADQHSCVIPITIPA